MINAVNKAVTIAAVPVSALIRTYNIAGIRPLDIRDNPYEGKVNQSDDRDPELYKSALGTPVVIDLTFESVTYTDFIQNRQITTEEIRLQTVLCSVERPSIIVKTQIQGRNGTVKEYISKDDFQVSINGIIAGENGQYPEAEALAIQRMCEAPVPIPVVSRFLNGIGIYNIVVDSYSLPQVAGGISRQDFNITAISDEPLELQIQ